MSIEIFGGGFGNKGAELMLRTVTHRLREVDPDTRLAVEPTADADYQRRAALGLAHIHPSPTLMPGWSYRFLFRSALLRAAVLAPTRWCLPANAERRLGLVPRGHCDAMLDISGYAFGDGFSHLKAKYAADRSRSYARRGRPVVYLPQMFGPFKKPAVRDAFRRCCEDATLIYARERPSYEAVRELIGDDPRLRIAPDLTIFSPKPAGLAFERPESRYACIVPNERMQDQGRAEWGDTYLGRLEEAAVAMHANNVRPVLVVHSGDRGDERMAQELHATIEQRLGAGTIGRFTHPDPFVLKAFIGGARFLIGSRFHSIVAALSSGVPGLALGWAHKYEALVGDFSVPELQHRGSDAPADLATQVEMLCDDDSNERLRGTIEDARERMRGDAETMWCDVFAALGRSARTEA